MRIAVIGSGESVNKNLVKDIEKSKKFDKIIYVSDAYKLSSKSDKKIIVSSDKKWWMVNIDNIKNIFFNEKLTLFSASRTDIDEVNRIDERTYINSGLLALIVAVKIYDAKEIGLFGIDMKGSHFFGKHTGILDNTTQERFEIFKKQFEIEKDKEYFKNVKVLNYNLNSALECFEKRDFYAD